MRQSKMVGIPEKLRARDQWVVTKNKKPRVPAEGWPQPGNQLSLTEATRYAAQLHGSVAFCFTVDDSFIGVDLDKVRQENSINDDARTIVEQLDSYTEISTSGTGLHIITEGEHLGDHQVKSPLDEDGTLEIYDDYQYFVITGNVFEGQSAIKSNPEAVDALIETHFTRDTGASESAETTTANIERTANPSERTEYITPEQVRCTIETYANNEHSDVDHDVLRLWNGSDLAHDSPSEADMAFVGQLYFWCGGDPLLMNECFCKSNRMRPKWGQLRGNRTYGEITIQKACKENSAVFNGTYVNVRK